MMTKTPEQLQLFDISKDEESPTPQTPIVNLVSTVDDDEQKKIALDICTDYRNDLQSRSQWEENRNKWYKLWACIRDKKTTPWEGASNVCIPMLASASNQFHARSYQSIFAPKGIVKTIPVGDNDIRRAEQVEKFMNWQIESEMEEYEEVFDKLLQLLPINGTAFKKLYWDEINEKPVTEYISPLDIILPYRTKSLETARRITHRLYLHYDELLDRNEMGIYENFDKLVEASAPTILDPIRETADEAIGEDAVVAEDEPHTILECHKKLDIGEGRKPYIITVDFQSQTILRITSREFQCGEELKTLSYFIDYHFIPNPEGFYSFGFGHFLEPLNEMANTAFNQIFDSGRLSNQPFGFYGRRAGIKKRKIKLSPGKMTEVEDASQIYFPSMQRVDSVLFNILGLVQQYTEQFTSTSDYISGRESKGTKTPTASGTLAIIEQGLVTFAVMTKRIFRSLRKELRLQMTLNQLFLPDVKEYRIMEGDSFAFPDMKAEDFPSVNDIYPTGDPSYASRGVKRQEAMEIYQILMSNPLIGGSPPNKEGQSAFPPNIQAIHELTSNIIDTYEIKNKGKILPDLPPQPMSPEAENAMIMQGDEPQAVMGENHQAHLESHLAFQQGKFFANLPPEYAQLMTLHIAQTQQVMYIESVQRQQQAQMQQEQAQAQAGMNEQDRAN